jgi:hypothetical protein
MSFVVEDGYNTSYIVVLLMALFYDKSMIERYLLIDNNSDKFNGLYLQKLIYYNFVKQIRNNVCVTSKMLNEIRLGAITVGWKNSPDIFETYGEFDPIDLLCFFLKLINYVPIEFETKSNRPNAWNIYGKTTSYSSEYDKFMIIPVVQTNMQDTYDHWAHEHKIINIPIFVIFKLGKIKSAFKINKKISPFQKNHQYHNIKWVFHSLFYEDGTHNYKTIMNKDSKLVSFRQDDFPNVQHFNKSSLQNIENKTVYVIYRKEPTV